MKCQSCTKFFLNYHCSAATYGDCDCPKCQGFCTCKPIMAYKDIKSLTERCEDHPDHEGEKITHMMIVARLCEEIAELRTYIELKELNT